MKIEIRANGEAIIEGYVNAVGRESRPIKRAGKEPFVEIVAPGTFAKAIQRAKNIEVRLNHSQILGSTNGGELSLKEDNIGLYAKVRTSNPEIIEAARKKELRGWSFGFYSLPSGESWESSEGKYDKRTLIDIELAEVSILHNATPAYIATSIEMRDGKMAEYRVANDETEVIEEKPPKKNTDLLHKYKNKLKLLEV